MAFDRARAGKEKQLKDTYLIFFAKRREMVETYNALNKKYEQIKIDFEEELKVKDKIIKQWMKRHGEACKEIKLAKLIMQDFNLSSVATKEFKANIEDEDKEILLKEKCQIKDLLPDYWFAQKCFEVTDVRMKAKKKHFDKERVTVHQKNKGIETLGH